MISGKWPFTEAPNLQADTLLNVFFYWKMQKNAGFAIIFGGIKSKGFDLRFL